MNKVDMDKIAEGLGAQRRGKVTAGSGAFGAAQLVAEVQARFRVPAGGGRATNPAWTTRRLLPLADETLDRLEQIAHDIQQKRCVHIEPMQLAAVLLEKSLANITEEDQEQIARTASAV
jgi:hypothetical protein